MFSPLSPRKSAKNSPRKPLLSPSELTPFSFSSDNLHLFDDEQHGASAAVVNESGIVPMSMSLSQPRTPTSSSAKFSLLHPQSAPGGRSYSLNGSLIGSLGSGCSGVREVDDTIRDLRKENFNLKLRIYFLEERLGSSSRFSNLVGSKEEILQANMELKVQCESLKYDVKEKTELLAEAGKALDHMEARLTSLTSEREEERKSIEEKLKLLEDLPSDHYDEDNLLLHEVEQELKGVTSRIRPERGCQTDTGNRSVLVAVPEEKDVEHLASKVEDLESSVEQLTIVINDTEACLHEAQQKAFTLQQELTKREAQIEALAKESRTKAEAAVKAQKELADLAIRATDQAEESESRVKAVKVEKETLLKSFADEKRELLAKLKQLQEIINDKDLQLKNLSLELESKCAQLEVLKDLNESSGSTKGCEINVKNYSDHNKTTSSCSSPDGGYKIVHQSVPSLDKSKTLSVVTQYLHVPPSPEASDSTAELEKLRKEVRKLREYARLSVQDRKVLIHKIGALKDKVHETHARKSLSPGRVGATSEASIQCNLLETKNYWVRFAKLQQKLVRFSEATDLMRSQLEVTCELLTPATQEVAKYNKNMAATLSNICKSNSDLLQSVELSLEDLKDSSSAGEDEQDNQFATRPSSALSNEVLPDPSNLDLEASSVQALELQVEQKSMAISALADQVEQKDRVIREQAEHLDRYRMEILHLRGESQVAVHQQQPILKVPIMRRSKCANKSATNTTENLEEGEKPAAGSDEEDSWSEPDVAASRKRMGLSQHVLSLIEKTGASSSSFLPSRSIIDSSETEEQCRQRLKRFYALDYTEQDFSDSSSNCSSKIQQQEASKNEDESQCKLGAWNCLLNSLQEYSRIMDELSFQLSLSDTLIDHKSNDSPQTSDDEMEAPYDTLDDSSHSIKLDLCYACSKSLPMELEDCLHKWAQLLVNSTLSLKHLRKSYSKLKRKLRQSQGNVSEKNLLISQLEEAIKHLGAKVESTSEEVDKKSKDLAELHQKMNENYRLVAELSSDNLRLSTEKAAAEQLLDEIQHDKSLLKAELNKAQKIIEDSMAGQESWHARNTTVIRPSSPETSASSFDYFPPNSPASHHKGQRRRGSMPPGGRGRAKTNNRKWKGTSNSDYASEVAANESPARRRSFSRPNANAGSDVSSPDLGVDLGSDPFSSLERSNSITAVTSPGAKNASIAAIMEENKRLKQDKERLSEKLSQSKGALRETLDRLHKKDSSTMSPMPSRRIFSSAVAAAVTNQPPPTLKEEFLAFSKSHRFHKGAGGNNKQTKNK